jgi:hypothetical protein
MKLTRPDTWNKHSIAACADYLFGGRDKYTGIVNVMEEWIFWAESQGWQFEPTIFGLMAHQEAMLEWVTNSKPNLELHIAPTCGESLS